MRRAFYPGYFIINHFHRKIPYGVGIWRVEEPRWYPKWESQRRFHRWEWQPAWRVTRKAR